MNVHLTQNSFHANVFMENEINWITTKYFGINMLMKMNYGIMKGLQNF